MSLIVNKSKNPFAKFPKNEIIINYDGVTDMTIKYDKLRIIDKSITEFNKSHFKESVELLNSLKRRSKTQKLLILLRKRTKNASPIPVDPETAARKIFHAIETFNARYGAVSMDMDNFCKRYPAGDDVSGRDLTASIPDRAPMATREPMHAG